MKTIEEKAKAYDEAVNKLRRFMEQGIDPLITRADVQDFFPELAESEGEKVIKRITLCLEECVHSDVIRDYEKDECIAWLENIPYTIDHEKREGFHLGYKACLEKQGEKHPDPYNGISFEYNGHIWGMCARDNGVDISCDKHLIKHLEEQGEQKPVDKDEPKSKFKVGDWVVQNDLGIYKIVEVCESWYEVISYNDGIQYSIGFDKENDCHLWTIQDAKPGDVLACPNDAGDRDVVFIFKNINSNEGWVFCFCASDANGCFCTNNDYVGNSNSTNISPATKEQRDLLFHKMNEAGYTFDFERKELKKIVQKPEENKGNVGGISPNWSEEDEDYLFLLNSICKDAEEKYRNSPDVLVRKEIANARNWLHSLKNRVQPKQEWNEEDEQHIDSLLKRLDSLCRNKFERTRFAISEDRDWLKSLRHQNRWKPSDVQMNNK